MKREGDFLWLNLSDLDGGSTSPAITVEPENERRNGIQGRPRMRHTYWQIMQISNAVNTDVTQRTSEQTNAASVLWNFIITLLTRANAFCMQLKLYF